MSDDNVVRVEIPIPDAPSMMDSIVAAAMEPEKLERPKGRDRVDCEICGKNYSKKHIYNHMRRDHNVFGGKSGIIRTGRPTKASKAKKTMEIATTPVVPNGHKTEKLPPLTAEQITRAAAESLFPEGVPHDKLTAILRWNIQTHYFLAEVQQ